jgi:hypothetical protein
MKKLVLSPSFSFLFLEGDDERIFNDQQFKRFLIEFMEILDAGELESTELALNAYPIADLVLVYFFRSLAILSHITHDFDSYIDKRVLLGFLLSNFSIEAQIFEGKCIKFIEAEVFVYEESPSEVYMVYKDIDGSVDESGSRANSSQGRSADSLKSSK